MVANTTRSLAIALVAAVPAYEYDAGVIGICSGAVVPVIEYLGHRMSKHQFFMGMDQTLYLLRIFRAWRDAPVHGGHGTSAEAIADSCHFLCFF